jgi:hypothetical protein
MSEDLTRTTLGLSALAGGAVWGLYHLATTLLAGQPVHRQDLILAAANVAAAVTMGALVAYFVGPVLIPLVPIAGLRDPHAVGFAIGAVAWEAAPFAYRWLRVLAAKKADGGAS